MQISAKVAARPEDELILFGENRISDSTVPICWALSSRDCARNWQSPVQPKLQLAQAIHDLAERHQGAHIS